MIGWFGVYSAPFYLPVTAQNMSKLSTTLEQFTTDVSRLRISDLGWTDHFRSHMVVRWSEEGI